MSAAAEARVAHASRVLIAVSHRSNLPGESSRPRDAIASTRDARATRKEIPA